ncbi:MAG: DUF4212 domain-containing protein [Parvibaculaceae bacterium]
MADDKNGPPDRGTSTYRHEGENPAGHDRHEKDVLAEKSVSDYWRANLKLLGMLLAVWFVVSFGLSILFVDALNAIPFFGFKLGFWWAQQGSIYVFIGLIFYYAFAMQRLERTHGVDDEE